jgi:hypothetical protein
VQALVAAIGMEGAPALKKMDLRKTAITEMGKNMLMGIKLMRPGVAVQTDE